MTGAQAKLVPQRKIEMPKIEMPKIEPAPRIEFDMDGSARWLKRMDGRNTKFICKLEWSWTPFNERVESYYLHLGRTHWILWRKPFDDNWGRWEEPIAIARCPWKELRAGTDAAMICSQRFSLRKFAYINLTQAPLVSTMKVCFAWKSSTPCPMLFGAIERR